MSFSRTKRNVLLLAVCQGLNGTSMAVVMLAGPLAGYMLVEDKTLATLPHAMQWVATMAAAFPASMFMQRVGRRLGFISGELFFVIGSLLAIYALITAQYAFLLAGACFIGAGNGFAIFYRFAAAEAADETYRSRAISYVLAGGVVAGFIGPEIAKQTRELITPGLFAGCYIAVIGVTVLKVAVLSRLDLPRPTSRERATGGRPLLEIARQPRYVIALTSSMVAWGVMVLLMASTPLAMQAYQLSFGETAFVIQWHIVGMFAPSFVTGTLIARFGLPNIMLIGALLQAGAVTINLTGIEVWNFWASNLIQGIGWNFLFIGGTTLLIGTYSPAERARAQGLNDMMVFGVAALASFGSGAMHHLVGWQMVNFAVIPLILVVFVISLWLRTAAAAAPAE